MLYNENSDRGWNSDNIFRGRMTSNVSSVHKIVGEVTSGKGGESSTDLVSYKVKTMKKEKLN